MGKLYVFNFNGSFKIIFFYTILVWFHKLTIYKPIKK